MKGRFLFFIFLTLILSCNSESKKKKTEESFKESNKTEVKVKENIRFDFSAIRKNSLIGTMEINATLYNDNIDTVYFLSTSCYGEQKSLRYNKSKFKFSEIYCNVSNPILIKIAPNGKHNFQADFICSDKEKKIKLGFDFHSVEKSFDLSKISLYEVLNKKESNQTIIWANEKEIK